MGDGPRETGALIDPSTDTWRERFRLARRDRRAARAVVIGLFVISLVAVGILAIEALA